MTPRRPRRPTPIHVPPPPTATVAEFVATLAATIGAIVLLFLVDSALARVDLRGRRAYAAREFAAGERLIAAKKLSGGIERLRTATMLDATNTSYGTALAEAMMTAGKPQQAADMLSQLLERDATDGPANLAMARSLAVNKRVETAKSYYHRAIYGIWPPGSDTLRNGARFELIELLGKMGARQELLAELLPIEEDSSSDMATRKRIARHFMAAGSPARAVSIFRSVLHRNPRDTASYIGLADAAMTLGDYRSAQTNLLSAQKLAPDDSTVAQRIALTDSTIALDPTQRGLSLDQQAQRSRRVLQLTLASVRGCLGRQGSPLAEAVDSSAQNLVARPGSIEQTLALAQQLWGLRRTHCATEPGPNPLSLVQDRIAQ